MPDLNRQIRVAAYPRGVPAESDFRLVETHIPQPAEDQILVKTLYVSVDPYMRGLLRPVKSYINPVHIGDVMPGGSVGVILESRYPGLNPGTIVLSNGGWQEYALAEGHEVHTVDPTLAPISTALGVLGMPGLTAYFGMLDIGALKEGDSVFVSGAAGAVGSIAGQIAKIKGCRVVGSAGSRAKVNYLLNDLHFDAAFNYHEVSNYSEEIGQLCPDGIDVYFDNVGGPVTDAAFLHINDHARVVVCGQIEQYNDTTVPHGPRLLWHLIVKRARAEGFLVFQFADRYSEGIRQLAQWLHEDKLTYKETITEGIENTPKAFIGLFHGDNIGKQLVHVADV